MELINSSRFGIQDVIEEQPLRILHGEMMVTREQSFIKPILVLSEDHERIITTLVPNNSNVKPIEIQTCPGLSRSHPLHTISRQSHRSLAYHSSFQIIHHTSLLTTHSPGKTINSPRVLKTMLSVIHVCLIGDRCFCFIN